MRRLRRLFQTVQWKLVIIYISLILIAMQLIGIYFIRTVEQSLIDNFTESLNAQADSLAFNLEPYLISEQEQAERDNMDDLVQNLVTLNNAGVQVIDQNGVIIGGSESEKHLIGQKNVQIEVNRALLGSRAMDMRSDGISGQRTMVLAVPIESQDNRILGAVYLWASMKDVYYTIRRINGIFATGTVFALILTAALGVLLSRTITTPVKAITEQATAMANGDFERRVEVMSNDEIGQLGQAFNHMTVRLREALSQTEEERGKLASVLANMSDGVIATDGHGRIVVYNQRAKDILRHDLHEGDDLMRVLSDFTSTPSWPLAEAQEMIVEIVSPDDGQTHYAGITLTPYHRQDHHTGGAIAVVQDITEQEKLEQQRKEFVANVSHELRTPLTTIKSYLEALDDGAIKDTALRGRFLNVIGQETERMIRLVRDLLHMSRIDSQEMTFHKQATPVEPLLKEAINHFKMSSQKKDVQIHLELDEGLPNVWIDRDQIRRVLDNLLSNAIKYTASGGEIRIAAGINDDDCVKVTVQDTGIGIPKKHLARIFERFYRVDKARSRHMGGTGLGLSIAREIVRAHGGQIDIESQWQEGTAVSFTLPVFHQEAPS